MRPTTLCSQQVRSNTVPLGDPVCHHQSARYRQVGEHALGSMAQWLNRKNP
jgi:hypothetical protein